MIGSRMTGRGDHLVVEHDGERQTDVLRAWPAANLRAPDVLKRKLTIGSLVR